MKSKPISQYWRVFSAFLVFALLVGSVGYSPAKAQSSFQFEGIIAYEDSTGNIILASGDGKRVPLTTDADSKQNPLARKQKPTYEIFGFSPNGAYLAVNRWSDDEGARMYIYDVANGNITAKLNFSKYSLYYPLQWHNDNDSIIAHQSVGEETGFENTTDDHEYYYRVYFSGERDLLFDTYSNPNSTNINFDLNTFFEFDQRHNPGRGGILHNWIEGTKYMVEITNSNVSGVWTHDETSFIYVDNEYGNILVFDLKTGAVTKNVDIPYGMWALYDLLSSSPKNYFLLSPDSKHLLLTDDYAGLYDLSLETTEVESVYTWPVNKTENEIKALWSNSGNLIMVNTYSANDQRVLLMKKGNLPVHVATNAEPLFWLSKDSERLVYAQYNVSGNQIDGDLMVYDHATGASTKVGNLPTIKDVDVSSGISYGYYRYSVDWTNGEVDLPEAPPLPENPFENELCPYDPLFSDKQTLINLLQDTFTTTTYPVTTDLPLIKLPNLNYNETGAQSLLDSLKEECSNYENMSREEKLELDHKMSAFARLTYTERSLDDLLAQVVLLSEKIANALSDFVISIFSVITVTNQLGDWLETRAPGLSNLIGGFKEENSSFLLDMLDKMPPTLKQMITKAGNFLKDQIWEKIRDISVENSIDKWLAGLFVERYITRTQSEIDIAVANVPPESNQAYPVLELTETNQKADDAIRTLTSVAQSETAETVSFMDSSQNVAEGTGVVADAFDLSANFALISSASPAAPVTLPLATLLKQVALVMKAIVALGHGVSIYVGASQYEKLSFYATNSANIAFDPSKITDVLVQENQIDNLDVASLNFVSINHIPASMYYSRYQEQTDASVDEYKASIERLMQAIASGQDEQIQVAAEELLRIDDELRASLKIAEAPLNEMSYDRPEVQNLDFSIQDLRAQSVTLHMALMVYMVERDSPEIQQETQIIVADVLNSADNFKANYDVLSQSGLAIPIKFLPVILEAKTPDAIVEGDTFSMTVKITNVGQISQQLPVTLSVAGGDKVEVSVNQPLPDLAPNSQIEIPVNLKAKQDGNEFITIELIQDGNVIASKIVYLEIGKSNSIFSLLPTSYLVGGGLSLLCLTILAIGGVFVYTRTRKPKRTPAKSVGRPQPSKPVSGSAEQIKKAIELSKSKRHKEAFEILRGVVQKEPNNMSAWFNLGGVLAEMGNYKDAERCYSRAKQLGHPRGEDALIWLRQHRK